MLGIGTNLEILQDVNVNWQNQENDKRGSTKLETVWVSFPKTRWFLTHMGVNTTTLWKHQVRIFEKFRKK